jgi:hypothetical protein
VDVRAGKAVGVACACRSTAVDPERTISNANMDDNRRRLVGVRPKARCRLAGLTRVQCEGKREAMAEASEFNRINW